jgi:hypothetical protein
MIGIDQLLESPRKKSYPTDSVAPGQLNVFPLCNNSFATMKKHVLHTSHDPRGSVQRPEAPRCRTRNYFASMQLFVEIAKSTTTPNYNNGSPKILFSWLSLTRCRKVFTGSAHNKISTYELHEKFELNTHYKVSSISRSTSQSNPSEAPYFPTVNLPN